ASPRGVGVRRLPPLAAQRRRRGGRVPGYFPGAGAAAAVGPLGVFGRPVVIRRGPASRGALTVGRTPAKDRRARRRPRAGLGTAGADAARGRGGARRGAGGAAGPAAGAAGAVLPGGPDAGRSRPGIGLVAAYATPPTGRGEAEAAPPPDAAGPVAAGRAP